MPRYRFHRQSTSPDGTMRHYFTSPTIGPNYVLTMGEGPFHHGRDRVAYTFGRVGEPPIFTGDDFGPSPMNDPLGYRSALGLLTFLTLRPGDTDSDYFDAYTSAQLAWANSYDCEALQGEVSTAEERMNGRGR